ncbi:hypothetical protein N3K66_004355 [Trichothecium roseum]|uniref:Uncharacterized protein n=1 Tax=Trichothecium roseum TaxID=47278 RepID=A0ACC0V317_9HYPO|nr:hypothetical protein N3K66_004355 [Trichothecium roseum]
MCGRYAQVLRPSQVRYLLREEDLPIDYASPDEGEGTPRQSYNFAPGYNGVVCRAVQGPHDEAHIQSETNTIPGSLGRQEQSSSTAYKLESMKWGLIPFWTKRDPGYSQIMRTMNCRDDSLSQVGVCLVTSLLKTSSRK